MERVHVMPKLIVASKGTFILIHHTVVHKCFQRQLNSAIKDFANTVIMDWISVLY